jgi:flagellar biosynthesis/type III secretory pathway protein FliH
MERGVQQGHQKGMQQGLKKGLKEGLEQGKTEGEIAAARAAVVDVLESRFNRVPVRLSSQLNRIADAERLRYLVRQAATAATVKDFERQLTS